MTAPTPTTRLTLGLDLTGLGAKAPLHTRARSSRAQHVSLGDVSDYLLLAAEAGIDLVTVGESFRLDDAARPDAWLDPAVLVSRLAAAGLLHGATAIVPALPAGLLDPVRLARAVAGLQVRTDGRAGWQLPATVTAGGVHAEVRRVWAGDRALVTAGAPLLVTAPAEPEAAVVAGRHSDVVRLRVSDLAEAAARREAIRTAAAAAGRNPDDVRVVVDVVTVIAQDELSAQFRADLLRDVSDGASEEAATLTLAGTAQTVADALEEWAGVVDGFVLVPGSLPTDALAIAHGLVPELAARGLVPAPAAASAPQDAGDLVDDLAFVL
ncbi:alkanesulfonate monooxygenase SsuD/methylene tetrahydromethanopterin reductase-like flavin-dependent oxidoreductase (luciferase family) [Salana multivorans]|uniref:Alkanesulfonate monooxygenase SsuD/methylene tetrahydromethanopterin reductase-like flavin-dependent oxidoreductase (Luciferase family) n=1 Tax=Salana multivorans TaxID=120377 RepID=A0A3N2D039_9MICO|nr:LLM class flavin-dependent oxidoreductase [Salana multivorans]ROR93152.1 alkanesulfonate monooxygenase SsuD/methylene tetrahydromethanopterin reductase-like flavin-dependent oxidoreductase (luciferase family) [Salana multivorans]